MVTRDEKKRKLMAATGTILVNAFILLVLIFASAFNTAGSGGTDMGVEVNLGYDLVGTGDIQPTEPIGDPDATDDDDAQADPDVAPRQESTSAETNAKPSESPALTDPNSDVEIKEEKKEVKPVEKPVVKPVEKPIEKPVEKKPEQKPLDKTTLYNPNSKTTTNTNTGTGDGRKGEPGNHGDNNGEVGDKGNPNGKLDATQLYGTPGTGGPGSGPLLDLYGWQWDYIPKPQVSNGETGQVVFEIKVNDDGDVESIRKISSGVSPAAEQACVATLQKLTFTKKAGAKVPEFSTGKITFVFRAE